MATLHILSSSPFADNRLSSCLRLLGPGDGLLLCGDAVYALQPGSEPCQQLRSLNAAVELYALDEDLQARALQPLEGQQTLDYTGFVALACRFSKVNSWL